MLAKACGHKSADKPKSPEVSPAGYLVGDSDVIRVNVWKEPEVSQTVVVRTDGNISLPLINEVKVAGMTPLHDSAGDCATSSKHFSTIRRSRSR